MSDRKLGTPGQIQQACAEQFWAILDQQLTFVFLDPILSQGVQRLSVGSNLLDFVHSDDADNMAQLVACTKAAIKPSGIFGYVSTCRYANLFLRSPENLASPDENFNPSTFTSYWIGDPREPSKPQGFILLFVNTQENWGARSIQNSQKHELDASRSRTRYFTPTQVEALSVALNRAFMMPIAVPGPTKSPPNVPYYFSPEPILIIGELTGQQALVSFPTVKSYAVNGLVQNALESMQVTVGLEQNCTRVYHSRPTINMGQTIVTLECSMVLFYDLFFAIFRFVEESIEPQSTTKPVQSIQPDRWVAPNTLYSQLPESDTISPPPSSSGSYVPIDQHIEPDGIRVRRDSSQFSSPGATNDYNAPPTPLSLAYHPNIVPRNPPQHTYSPSGYYSSHHYPHSNSNLASSSRVQPTHARTNSLPPLVSQQQYRYSSGVEYPPFSRQPSDPMVVKRSLPQSERNPQDIPSPSELSASSILQSFGQASADDSHGQNLPDEPLPGRARSRTESLNTEHGGLSQTFPNNTTPPMFPLPHPRYSYSSMHPVRPTPLDNYFAPASKVSYSPTAPTPMLPGYPTRHYYNSDDYMPLGVASETLSQSTLGDKSLGSSVGSNASRQSSPPEPSRKEKGKRSKRAPKICDSCQTNYSPEWRRGPQGLKTLCNACGLRYARANARKKAEAKANAAHEEAHRKAQRPEDDMRERYGPLTHHEPPPYGQPPMTDLSRTNLPPTSMMGSNPPMYYPQPSHNPLSSSLPRSTAHPYARHTRSNSKELSRSRGLSRSQRSRTVTNDGDEMKSAPVYPSYQGPASGYPMARPTHQNVYSPMEPLPNLGSAALARSLPYGVGEHYSLEKDTSGVRRTPPEPQNESYYQQEPGRP